MNWYKITTVDGGSAFYEIDLGVEQLRDCIVNHDTVRVERTIVLIPQEQNGRHGVVSVQRNKIDPMLACCDSNNEFIVAACIISFSLVDVESEVWNKISENALEEHKLIKPNKKLIVP